MLDHQPHTPTPGRSPKATPMTIPRAISILSLAANGHAFTTGQDFWTALRMGVEALVQQRQREEH